jgi:hypothetical protein
MKNHMKNILILFIALIVFSCVDDYTDYNGQHLLDAPVLRVSESGEDQSIVLNAVNQYQSTPEAFLRYGAVGNFTVNVIKSPGMVSSVSVTPSVPEFGTITIDESSVLALQGKESGEFKFTYTPNPRISVLRYRMPKSMIRELKVLFPLQSI